MNGKRKDCTLEINNKKRGLSRSISHNLSVFWNAYEKSYVFFGFNYLQRPFFDMVQAQKLYWQVGKIVVNAMVVK